MVLNEEVRKEYFNALYNQQNGYSESMKVFKGKYPNEYAHINAIYHKRVKVKKDIETMRKLSNNNVYFGTLTFDESKDKKKIDSKRQETRRFLNKVFIMFLMVEELGAEEGRYHIHFCGVFKEGKRFNDFFKWHSRTDIQRVKSTRSVARYLCDYMTKQVPRLRRNRTLVKCSKNYLKGDYFSAIGFKDSIGEDYKAKAYSELFIAELEDCAELPF